MFLIAPRPLFPSLLLLLFLSLPQLTSTPYTSSRQLALAPGAVPPPCAGGPPLRRLTFLTRRAGCVGVGAVVDGGGWRGGAVGE